jgi:hypothetical protein
MTPKTGKVFKGQQFIAGVRYERCERADRTQSGLPGLVTVGLRLSPALSIEYFGDRLTLR